VQGYSEDGERIGKPGDQQTYYDWPGTGQMFSSARDMAVFLAANLAELTDHRRLQEAMQFAQQGVVAISPRNTQALAWEINFNGEPPIVEKNGGLNNSSTYIGMIPARKLGIVILANRGNQDPAEVGRRVMWKLASMGSATLHHSGVPRGRWWVTRGISAEANLRSIRPARYPIYGLSKRQRSAGPVGRSVGDREARRGRFLFGPLGKEGAERREALCG
jgi:CubicO group peptidase (beta-lactamase class C family)